MATAYPGIEVIGIDISIGMIEYARAQARAYNLQNAQFSPMDITRQPKLPDQEAPLCLNARDRIGC